MLRGEKMDEVIKFMINRDWEKDYKQERKIYLLNIAKECENSEKIADTIGGILIYNQLVEQFLKETIICSISYIKAEIWPSSVQMNLDFDKATFGVLIEYFKQFAVKEYNRDVILKYLKDIKKTRNDTVHRLFEIKDIKNLKNELNDYYGKSFELVMLLNEYYNEICWKLDDLSERIDWNDFCE